MKKSYAVCDSWGSNLEVFETEKEREQWLKKYCYHNGINWLVYDLSKFPYRVGSRTIYTDTIVVRTR